jgi:aminoglycoside 3-N-acetyltransferase I
MPGNIDIRKLSAADIDLATALFLSWRESETKLPGKEYLVSLLNNDAFHIFAAISNNRVVGGLTAYEMPMYLEETKEVFLYEIGVTEEYLRHGIASALINALKTICRDRSIRYFYVGTETDNHPARQLYKKTQAREENIAWFTYDLKEI